MAKDSLASTWRHLTNQLCMLLHSKGQFGCEVHTQFASVMHYINNLAVLELKAKN